MNMNLSLNIDIKTLLAIARKSQVYVFGLALVAVFAYTSLVVDQALNVKAIPSAADSTLTPVPKISFDKTTIKSLTQLSSVSGDVPTGNLGSDDPFR
jgi:hypothetical protein